MTTKRFGSRYGKRVRDRLKSIESLSKRRHICPKCLKEKAKRVAMGIYECDKCGNKFASKAYKTEKPKL